MRPDLLSVTTTPFICRLGAFVHLTCAIASVEFRVPLTSDSFQCFDGIGPIPPRYWSLCGAEAPSLLPRRGRGRALRAGCRAAARRSAGSDAAGTTARRRDRMRTLPAIETRRASHRGRAIVPRRDQAAPRRSWAYRRPDPTHRSGQGRALARWILGHCDLQRGAVLHPARLPRALAGRATRALSE